MALSDQPDESSHAHGDRSFTSTSWNLVARAAMGEGPESRDALSLLCKIYWPPIYAYVRRRGHDPESALDLTQGFFASFLGNDSIARADPARGRFRSYLLGAVNHFLSNEWHRGQAQKRGGGARPISLDAASEELYARIEPRHGHTPESIYERQWGLTLLDHALERLREEKADSRHPERFERLVPLLTGEGLEITYKELAKELQMTEGNVKITVHRLRQRYGQLLREEVAQTLKDPSGVDDELRYLRSVLRS